MFKYQVKLPYKIECCAACPFRHEELTYEGINSVDKLSGVVNITRRQSFCNLRGEPIFTNENVEDYNSKCPLKDQGTYIEDKS